MPENVTERGFGVYAELTDTHGSEVRVQESSAADEACVWIFASHVPESRYIRFDQAVVLSQAGFSSLSELAAFLTPSPHLNLEQAVAVRDALDAFIREHAGEAGLAGAMLQALQEAGADLPADGAGDPS
jgi:hypothetical protein